LQRDVQQRNTLAHEAPITFGVNIVIWYH